MIKKLIVNADDFGITEGVTLGIIKAHVDGILTSTTTMMNMPYCKEALEMAKDYPNLGVGIHLVLSLGRPLSKKINSLTDVEGNFKNQRLHHDGTANINQDELYAEWKSQIELFIKHAGKKPDHLDSHHHMHAYYPEVTLRLASEYDVPVRSHMKLPYRFAFCNVVPDFYADKVSYEYFVECCTKYTDEIIEIPCHPAFVDKALIDTTTYNLQRTNDLAVLLDHRCKDFLTENNIELVNFQDL